MIKTMSLILMPSTVSKSYMRFFNYIYNFMDQKYFIHPHAPS